jgi:hypothetical protein
MKRMEPYSDADLAILKDMVWNDVSGVIPISLKTQILTNFNSLIPDAINKSLNS